MGQTLLGCATILLTIMHNDIWPKFWFNPDRVANRTDLKMMGTVLVWGVALTELVKINSNKGRGPETRPSYPTH